MFLNRMYCKMLMRMAAGGHQSLHSKLFVNEDHTEIYKGQCRYAGLTTCFINDMISQMELARLQGFKVYPNVLASNEKFNIWKAYFNTEDIVIPDSKSFRGFFFENTFSQRALREYCNLYKCYCALNYKTNKYFMNEYKKLGMDTMPVLGVVVRGTDYIRLKPKNHPKQPTVMQIISRVKKVLKHRDYKKIYLATEEKSVYDLFCEEFGSDSVLINERQWYDSVYNEMGNKLVDEIRFHRDNDDYLKGLEYLSSILLLSKCKGLIGGMSGATFAALCLNNQRYEYKYIFDLGYYS